MHKVYTITPVGPATEPAHLNECISSVIYQDDVDPFHVLVLDGQCPRGIHDVIEEWQHNHGEHVQCISIPERTADIGSTPRTVGAVVAWGWGAEWVSFLDADCRYYDSHLSQLIAYQQKTEKPIVCSGRLIESYCGKFREPCPEMVPGSDFFDTNTYLFRRTPEAVRASYTYGCLLTDEQHKVGDRILSVEARPLIGCHYRPTVVYRTSHRFHYTRFGWPVPPGLTLKDLSKPCPTSSSPSSLPSSASASTSSAPAGSNS